MALSKSAKPKSKQPQKARINLTIGEVLLKRASDYSAKTGINVTALLRNGLDLLLKQNNF